MNHSPEPWRIDESVIYAFNGESVNEMLSIDLRNIERIVSCVNFCRGLPIGVLENSTFEKELVAAWADGLRGAKPPVLSATVAPAANSTR